MDFFFFNFYSEFKQQTVPCIFSMESSLLINASKVLEIILLKMKKESPIGEN